MKTKLAALIGLVGVGCLPVQAQLFNSESVGGAALGGLIGGIVGHNSHGRTLEGIGIGAGAGLLLGGLAEEHAHRYERVAYAQAPVVYYSSPSYAAPLTYSTTPTPAEPRPPTPPAPVSNPSPATDVNPANSASPMSGANSFFGR